MVFESELLPNAAVWTDIGCLVLADILNILSIYLRVDHGSVVQEDT